MVKNKFAVKNTLGMFDFLKGFIMIIMLIAHTPGYFDNINFLPKYVLGAILGLFGEAAMPALMIIGGYGFRKTTLKKCLNKQYDTLIIPYIVTSLITVIVHFVCYYFMNEFRFRDTVKATLHVVVGLFFGAGKAFQIAGHVIPNCGPGWFLFAMAVGSIVFNILLNHFQGKKLFIASVIVAILGWGLSLMGGTPWCISQGLISAFFMSLGYFAKKKKLFTSGEKIKRTIIFSVALVVVFYGLRLVGNEFNMAYSTYTLGIITIFEVAIVSCFVVFWFLRINNCSSNFFINTIRNIGRNSLYVFCIHTLEIISVGRYLQDAYIASWQGPIWMRNLTIIGVRMIVVFGLTSCLVRIKNFSSQKLEIKGNIVNNVFNWRNKKWLASMRNL